MGWLDDSMLSVEYARNFYDTDQRPLRGMLERFAPPMLIVHGRHDVLVPFAAAREHHRLVPQSEMVVMDANHFMVFRSPQTLANFSPLTMSLWISRASSPTRRRISSGSVTSPIVGSPCCALCALRHAVLLGA